MVLVKDNQQITAMIMLSQVGAPRGWLLKFLVFSPMACHDTTEFLMASVLKILKEENCHFLTKGMVPIDSLAEIKGLSTLSNLILRGAYKLIGKTFKFKQRKEYWQRYHPQISPAYLLLTKPHIGIQELRALTKIFRHSFKH